MKFVLDCGHIFRIDREQIALLRVVKCNCGKETDLTSWFEKVAHAKGPYIHD